MSCNINDNCFDGKKYKIICCGKSVLRIEKETEKTWVLDCTDIKNGCCCWRLIQE